MACVKKKCVLDDHSPLLGCTLTCKGIRQAGNWFWMITLLCSDTPETNGFLHIPYIRLTMLRYTSSYDTLDRNRYILCDWFALRACTSSHTAIAEERYTMRCHLAICHTYSYPAWCLVSSYACSHILHDSLALRMDNRCTWCFSPRCIWCMIMWCIKCMWHQIMYLMYDHLVSLRCTWTWDGIDREGKHPYWCASFTYTWPSDSRCQLEVLPTLTCFSHIHLNCPTLTCLVTYTWTVQPRCA